jgi:hypothetical protein
MDWEGEEMRTFEQAQEEAMPTPEEPTDLFEEEQPCASDMAVPKGWRTVKLIYRTHGQSQFVRPSASLGAYRRKAIGARPDLRRF